MVLDTELLSLLRCPLTAQSLVIAPEPLISRLEAERLAGALRDHSGKLVAEKLVAGLLCADGSRFFPIRNLLPVLLADESIPLPYSG